SSATVLIQGESGTGKEVVSKSIHNLSPRKGRPFVKVSCASIPDTLLESELFGYERGAFTGAIGRKEGRFEWADGGTLFLDEVGEMNVASQVKLLRAIQEGEFERLGGKKTLKSDVRLIAATNIDLIKAVQEKKFREDLYYRLNVITINLPPLRERKDDIPLLISQFLQFFSTKNAKNIKGISKEAIGILMAYNWPGNVRELENVVERAVVLARDEEILNPDHFPPRIFTGIEKSPVVRIPIGTPIDKIEEKVVEETLKYSKGDKDVASKLLGISRRTLYRKIPKKKNSEEK
ncbi:MAG: sigma 54-interacting transcriptional regulator, partial [Thermodesulfobacteriota bacterium]|nr:sigma 54-interacting transcriptional regulator [Thermodesulfobacteriota bacterium]